jgi:hypothetical protein
VAALEDKYGIRRMNVTESFGRWRCVLQSGQKRSFGRGFTSFIVAAVFIATFLGQVYMVAILREPLSPTEQILFTLLELTLGCYLAYSFAQAQNPPAVEAAAPPDGERTLLRTREIYNTTRRLSQIIERKRQLVHDPVLLESFDVIQSVVDELRASIVASHNDIAVRSGTEQGQLTEIDELKAKQQEVESRAAIREFQDEILARQSAFAERRTIKEALRSNAPTAYPVPAVTPVEPPVETKAETSVETPPPVPTAGKTEPVPAAGATGGYTVHSLSLGGAKEGRGRSRGK